MSILDRAWAQREQQIFPELFGDTGEGIYTLSFDTFKNQFNCESVDPTWLHYGVFKCPPNERRKTWLYVTSGMSNPWGVEEPQEYSGLGMEFLLETKTDENWAIPLVQSLLAFNILLSVGKYGEKPILWYGDRIPQPIEPNLSHIVLGEPTTHPKAFELVSGKTDIVQIIGVTKTEFEYAKEHGSDVLCELLQNQGIYPITDPNRHAANCA